MNTLSDSGDISWHKASKSEIPGRRTRPECEEASRSGAGTSCRESHCSVPHAAAPVVEHLRERVKLSQLQSQCEVHYVLFESPDASVVTSVLLRPAWMNTLMQNTHLHPSKRELWPLGKEVRGTVFGGPRSVDVSCILAAASLEVARKLVPGEEGGQKESSR